MFQFVLSPRVFFVMISLVVASLVLWLFSDYSHGRRMTWLSPAMPLRKMEQAFHDKWIVVTTVSPPTEDIAKLAAIPGWMLLVVGDSKTPKNWSFPDCIFLGIEQQRVLGYSIIEHTPTGSYTRKNIGYLYAIQHGAQYIYDTDDDNHPDDGILDFPLEPIITGLEYADTSKDIMNPYAHFGQPSIWPRGFPLDKVTQKNNNTYKLSSLVTPSIQQGLVNGDPDVDAIYRLIKKKQGATSLSVQFDRRAPPAVLPDGVFAPFNSQNTLFHREAFWALLLPQTVAFRVTDIWRGYWAQRLVWLVGQQLGFFPPNAVQFRNPHSYLSDFQEELQFYSQSGEFVRFLSTWTCHKDTFSECIKQLSREMTEFKFWGKDDVSLVDFWLQDLSSIGYQLPELKTNPEEEISNKSSALVSPPIEYRTVFYNSPSLNAESANERQQDLLTICEGQFSGNDSEELKAKLSSNLSYFYPNVLLIIVFNFPYHRNIKLIDTLYRDHFPNMVFCSQADSYETMRAEADKGLPHWRVRSVSFINISTEAGYFGYECTMRAIEMNFRVDGYLVVGDDVMFNSWNFKDVNLSRVGLEIDHHRLENLEVPVINWVWWPLKMGRNSSIEALEEIKELAYGNATDTRVSETMKTFLDNRLKKGVNMTWVSLALSDVYYIPSSKAKMFLDVIKIFFKHRVFLEIAVPTTLNGMEGVKFGNQYFSGSSIWGTDRDNPFRFFNDKNHFLHSLKFSKVESEPSFRQKYCETYIRNLIKSW